jgi:hypothetical protein
MHHKIMKRQLHPIITLSTNSQFYTLPINRLHQIARTRANAITTHGGDLKTYKKDAAYFGTDFALNASLDTGFGRNPSDSFLRIGMRACPRASTDGVTMKMLINCSTHRERGDRGVYVNIVGGVPSV